MGVMVSYSYKSVTAVTLSRILYFVTVECAHVEMHIYTFTSYTLQA